MPANGSYHERDESYDKENMPLEARVYDPIWYESRYNKSLDRIN